MSLIQHRFRRAIRAVGLLIASQPSTSDQPDAECPVVKSGTGTPAAEPAGSLHLGTDGPIRSHDGTAWRFLAMLLSAATAAATAITGATETQAAFDQKATIPANRPIAGTAVRFRAAGIYTATTGSETHSLIVTLGGVEICRIDSIDPATGQIFYFEGIIQFRTVGALGTIVAAGTRAGAVTIGSGNAAVWALPSTTIDTTAAMDLQVEVDRQASATDSDSMRLDMLTVEILG